MATITITDLTTGELTGDGVFDRLMRASKAHLDEEFNKNRIRGAEYSQVYLGMVAAVMEQSIAFTLGQQQADKQAEFLAAQEAKVRKDISSVDLSDAVLTQQREKLQAEIAVLEQKQLTEEAQIRDTVQGAPVAGMLGQQKALYQAQKDGFARDAEAKLARLYIDAWNVQRTTDEGIVPDTAGLANSDIATVLNKARQGVGA